jgi:2-dehydropantoate 2-reductase
VVSDIIAAMQHKFGFIAATAALTCLTRGAIGEAVSALHGGALADRILQEVGPVPGLSALLHDSTSTFAPSMNRDLVAGRRVEADVLTEFVRRRRQQGFDTPVLEATVVALEVHNNRL